MIKTYKHRLYPTKAQVSILYPVLYLCRFLYNCMLEHRIRCYKAGKSMNRQSQQDELPNIKKEFPEYKDVHSQVLQEVTFRLQKAFDAFFLRIKKGEKPGFPRFKGRAQFDTFCYPQSGFSINGNKLSLSKIGDIKILMHRPIEGKILNCSITHKNGKFYACFACEVEAEILPPTGSSVGIDVGISDFVITSDGEFVPKSNNYHKAERRLKYLQRMVSRRKKGSNRRKKAVKRLAKAHEKVANQRKDLAHKTSAKLIKENDLIAHEDLTIQNMVKNHNLAKSISDAGWSMLFQFLSYKAANAGRQVVAVPPAYTSQICSGCGSIVQKKLSERWHNCPYCGLSIQRDVNAAINILAMATKII